MSVAVQTAARQSQAPDTGWTADSMAQMDLWPLQPCEVAGAALHVHRFVGVLRTRLSGEQIATQGYGAVLQWCQKPSKTWHADKGRAPMDPGGDGRPAAKGAAPGCTEDTGLSRGLMEPCLGCELLLPDAASELCGGRRPERPMNDLCMCTFVIATRPTAGIDQSVLGGSDTSKC